mgnify:CR=1 FL=1
MMKVSVVSGCRADYGLLYWVMREIQSSQLLELVTIVTGMHLSPEYGLTVGRFYEDGFPVTYQVDMALADDTPIEVTKSLGRAVIGFADAYQELQPDIVLILGDRIEMLAAAQAAMVATIPVAHIFGGDTTEGAIDEAIRHSITKMSHIHFASNSESAGRIIQMGENPSNVYNVGSTGIDAIRKHTPAGKAVLFEMIGFNPAKNNILITFHPATLGLASSRLELEALLSALDEIEDCGFIFTRSNSDVGGRELNLLIDRYVERRSHSKAYSALGGGYLSALSHVDAVVGNSSSGLYEAPSFGVATVNIGDRQKGRMQASSIINCAANKADILNAINRALTEDFSDTKNPFGDGYASARIISVLEGLGKPKSLLQKHFFEGVDDV